MISRRVSTAVVVLGLSIPAAVAAHPAARPFTRRPAPPAAEPAHSPLPLILAPVAGQPAVTYTAHRGGALEVPENSMSGLATAFARRDAQVLDFDTRMLRDGTLVVMHDATLDRTTDRTGPVRDLTAAQWRTVRLLPARSLRGTWRPERPPTVAEALDRFGGRITLMVEAKDPESLPRLATMIRDRGLTRSVYVNSNRPEVAREAHRRGLLAQLWRSARQMRTDTPRDWRGTVDLLDIDHRARDTDVRRAVTSGVPRVWAHTVNTPAQRDRMLRLGCDGIITDAPGRLTATPVRPPRAPKRG
ncbi:glycerophosphodiester phosphodiesterase [Streptomyces hygroscopicus]|uniref:Glycerophosphoryl diester phosphodiesterase n=1 Tax=Streptomyces demainii TaxID=588122 RepID=A0ABT9KSG5_9ACTN|nr:MULTISPECIES: glycerophosphodiester phosphodiesterase family protein [Streptomyces]MDN3057598.1 glycerophosphodiester phosphodiesterase family protein [Streptomyces sp. SRF1]MDP9610492.1 glycerophosphoryl diester phosphodiesterase [Streptomyces demainii]